MKSKNRDGHRLIYKNQYQLINQNNIRKGIWKIEKVSKKFYNFRSKDTEKNGTVCIAPDSRDLNDNCNNRRTTNSEYGAVIEQNFVKKCQRRSNASVDIHK